MQKYLSSEMQYYGDEEEPKKNICLDELVICSDESGLVRTNWINSDKLTICLDELRFNLNE